MSDSPSSFFELLAPAGNFEKLKTVLHYGADAVYAGLSEFSLRAQTGEFGENDLRKWVSTVHGEGKKIYITANIYPHNRDLPALREHAKLLSEMSPDGIVVSDPGAFEIFSTLAPQLPLHISTQANTTNLESVRFWRRLGAKRIVLARELSLSEIREIHDAVGDIDLEAFVHGAICIAYSGRCFLSSFMANRSGNRGECANSCRWSYSLVEEKRPGEYFPVFEDNRGTYIMSSKDLCLIAYIDQLMDAGVTSFKLEGRMKGINYAAGVVKIYREAIDRISAGESVDPYLEKWTQELSWFSSRGFTTGMLLGRQPDEDYNHDTPTYIRSLWELGGVVESCDADGRITVALRNTIQQGDRVRFLTPGMEEESFIVEEFFSITGEPVFLPGRNGQRVVLQARTGVRPGDLMRVGKGG